MIPEGPVWQYHLGRAVIAGVVSNSQTNKMKCTSSSAPGPDDESQTDAIWVDQEIDWIKSVIKNDTTN